MKSAEARTEVALQAAVVQLVPVAARKPLDAVALFAVSRELSHINTGRQSA
jgi:hypothetical protein